MHNCNLWIKSNCLALQSACVNVACLQTDPQPQQNIHDVTRRILFMEATPVPASIFINGAEL